MESHPDINRSDSPLSVSTSSSLKPTPLDLSLFSEPSRLPPIPIPRTDSHRSIAYRNARDLANIERLFSDPADPLPPSSVIEVNEEESPAVVLSANILPAPRSAFPPFSSSPPGTPRDATVTQNAPDVDPLKSSFRPTIAPPPRFPPNKHSTIPGPKEATAKAKKSIKRASKKPLTIKKRTHFTPQYTAALIVIFNHYKTEGFFNSSKKKD